MKFTAKEDIDAPIDAVFAMLTDFDAMERAAMRRGIDVQRKAPTAAAVVGLSWKLGFSFRGKPREARLTLSGLEAPNMMRFDSVSGGIEAAGSVELVALSQTRTRMATAVELEAQSLAGRLLLQSLKLAKTNLNKRFKLRMATFAKEIEDRHTKMA